MTDVDSRRVAAALDTMEWGYRVLDETTVLSGFRCNRPFYEYTAPFEIRCTRHWVYLRALLQKQVDARNTYAVLSFLAELNAACHRLRFLLVKGSVLAQLEIASVHFTDAALREALTVLGRYCDRHGTEISALATNRTVADLYEQVVTTEYRDASGAPATVDLLDFEIVVNTLAD